MSALSDSISDQDIKLIQLAAKAAGVPLIYGTTRIHGTNTSWSPLTNISDAASLLLALGLSISQSGSGISVKHHYNPDVTLASTIGNTKESFCRAITTAAVRMLGFN